MLQQRRALGVGAPGDLAGAVTGAASPARSGGPAKSPAVGLDLQSDAGVRERLLAHALVTPWAGALVVRIGVLKWEFPSRVG